MRHCTTIQLVFASVVNRPKFRPHNSKGANKMDVAEQICGRILAKVSKKRACKGSQALQL